ncbi:head fiber protein [Pseudomonas phage vB_PsaM_M1]|nr:head fiber protein [Pseudomonas phage vB_PsaM_M1]
MAIADVSIQEKGWVDAHDVIQRVITEINAEVPDTNIMPYQAPAAAADVAALKVQFDALLGKLVTAGLMAAS